MRARVLAAVPLLLLAVALGTALIATDAGSFTPDTKPEVYLAPARTLQVDASAWRPSPYLGQPHFDAGLIPADLVSLGLRTVGVPPWLVTRLLRMLLLLVAGAGTFTLVRRLDASQVAAVVATFVYVANPYIVTDAATLPILMPYAFLPWFVLALRSAIAAPRSWRGPALAALAFAGMGGQNAGVAALMQLLGVPAVLGAGLVRRELSPREAAGIVLRLVPLLFAVSLYWLVPALSALASASTIAAGTESVESITATTSFAEVMRLMGSWPTYGRDGGRLWVPNAADLVLRPMVVVASFLLPVAATAGALLTRSRARILGVLLLALAVPVAVSGHPPDAPSLFGRGLVWAFENVPGAIALRTTVKLGPLIALGLALLIGGLAHWVATTRLLVPSARTIAAQLAAVTLVVASLPLWTGGPFRASYRVPGYWQEASSSIDAMAIDDHRLWWLPGEHGSAYRWGLDGPGSLAPSLLDRRVVSRSSVPNGSVFQANLLAAADVPVNSGTVEPGYLSVMADYLGVDAVLARNDMVWERVGAARPHVLERPLVADPRIVYVRDFGTLGLNTEAPTPDGQSPQRSPDADLPPLRLWEVADPRATVWAAPVEGSLLIDGDAFSLPELHRLGLLEGSPPFAYLGGATPGQIAARLEAGARLVLTDGNRRRGYSTQRVDGAWTPTLRPEEALATDARAALSLFDPDRQTVAVVEGAVGVTATSSGSVFRTMPAHHAYLAFDGDPTTSWRTGDLRTAVGQSITLHLEGPQRIDRIALHPALDGTVQVSRALVHVEGAEPILALLPPAQEVVDVELRDVETAAITVEITGIRGEGANSVGFREIVVPGISIRRGLRLPRTLALAAEAGLTVPEDVPIDIVLTRAGALGAPGSDEEAILQRDLELPDPRTFTGRGVMRASGRLADDVVDRLVAPDLRVVATSSGRADGGNIALRASAALDGKSDTKWIAPGDGRGEWIDVSFPLRVLDGFTIEQLAEAGVVSPDAISLIDVTVNDTTTYRRRIAPGTSRVAIPEQRVGRVRIEIAEVVGFGGQVGIRELAIDGVTIQAPGPEQPLVGCHDVLSIDGAIVAFRAAGTLTDLVVGRAVPIEACEAVRLPAGPARLRSVGGWVLDSLHLSSGTARTDAALADLVVESRTRSRIEGTLTSEDRPTYLIGGEGFDARWRAELDGRDLGPPVLLNGYAIGWVVDEPGPHRFVLTYTPQLYLVVALLLSLNALGLLAVIVLATRVDARRPAVRSPVDVSGSRPSWIRWGAIGSIVVAAGLLDGLVGLVVGALVAAGVVAFGVRGRALLGVAVGAMALVPVAMLVSGLPTAASLSPRMVLDARVAHHLAFAALVLLVVGTLRDEGDERDERSGP